MQFREQIKNNEISVIAQVLALLSVNIKITIYRCIKILKTKMLS